ncbi:three-Cys-motif partner protein TcmP [Methylobacterium aquaticum]|nr:three-Cys-motif partner protein TcmP [Methylobacterium aquaticum]
MSKRPKDNTVGPWAEEKLDSLRRGLDYWTTRLKKKTYWEQVFVDAFAGPGMSAVRSRPADDKPAHASGMDDIFASLLPAEEADPVEQEVRYLKGSPRIALELPNPFHRYIFIEKDPERLAKLEGLKEEFHGRRSIEIVAGDANQALLSLLNSKFSKRTHRAYIFLDPFGIQVPWSTIEALAATEAIEVMINFPLGMAIRRMMPNSGDVPKGWSISLDTFFGTPDWRKQTYEEVTDLGGTRTVKFADSEERLLQWYRERLGFAFGHVSQPQLITNTRGGRLYYLIWAGPHPAGLKGADYILTMKSRGGPKKLAPSR